MNLKQSPPVREQILPKENTQPQRPSVPITPQKLLQEGQFHCHNAQYELAMENFSDAFIMSIGQNDESLALKVAEKITSAIRQQGSIPPNIDFASHCFSMLKRSTSVPDFALACQIIGDLYVISGDIQQGMVYLHKSLDRYQYLENSEGLSRTHGHLAENYLEMGDLTKAYIHATYSLENYSEPVNQELLCASLNTLGAILLGKGQPGNANRRFQRALALTQKENLPYELIRSQYYYGDLLLHQKQTDLAIDYLKRAVNSAKIYKTEKLILKCHQKLSEAYKQKEQYEAALEQLEQYQQLIKTKPSNGIAHKLRSMETAHKIESYNQRNEQLKQAIHERAKNQAELEHQATTDPLTGLSNRRHFFTLAEHICDSANVSGQELSAIMMDIDHFKSINDRYGHPVGDKVLVMVARRIHQNLREQDILCRYGGEEFSVLLPDTNLKSAYQVAERIREEISSQPFVIDEQSVNLTMSTGVADLINSPKNSLMGLLGHADQALYKSKHRGRNRTSVFSKQK